MIVRSVWGLLGGIFVIAILIFDREFPILFNLLISVVCLVAIYELFCSIGLTKPLKKQTEQVNNIEKNENHMFKKNIYIRLLTVSSLLFAFLLPIWGNKIFEQILWYVYTLFVFGAMLIMVNKINVNVLPEKQDFAYISKFLKFKDIIVIYSMTVCICFALLMLVKLRNLGKELSIFYVLIALGIAWFSDTGAYFGGSFLGKQKLCPEISPKKTVEGVISGAVVCVLLMLIVAKIFESRICGKAAKIDYIPFIVMCFFGAFVAVMGDLCFSLFKRSYSIKDFGDVLPGHGGLLDRFDSVIFVAPFVYFVLKAFSFIINIV